MIVLEDRSGLGDSCLVNGSRCNSIDQVLKGLLSPGYHVVGRQFGDLPKGTVGALSETTVVSFGYSCTNELYIVSCEGVCTADGWVQARAM